MAKLANVPVDDLHNALDEVSNGKAAKRLMIALAYKDGVSVDVLSERYAIPRSTVYYWLDRFEQLPIDEAIEDDDRPGRPAELTAEERAELQADIVQAPETFGFNAKSWSVEILHRHIRKKYDVEYSHGHVRRLLRRFEQDA